VTLLIQIGSALVVVLIIIIILRWLLGRGRIANLLDDDARRMVLRSLTILVALGGVLFVVASNNEEVERQLTQGVISFLPRAIAGSLILVASVVLGRLIGVLVGQALRNRSPLLGSRVGKALTISIIVMGSVISADQFGITTDLMLLIIGSVLAAIALGTGLAFGLGSLPMARQIAAGRHVDDRFETGDRVEIHGIIGAIESIGLSSSRITNDDGSWEIPNGLFLEDAVRIHTD
jgi:small-conductance mechanosensitive channel